MFTYGREQYTTKDEKERKLYKKEKNNENDRSTFLQLFESFMESAPQLLLQMYILAAKISRSQQAMKDDQCDCICTSPTNYSGLVTELRSASFNENQIQLTQERKYNQWTFQFMKTNSYEFLLILELLQIGSIFISLASLAFNLTQFQKITWAESWPLFPAHFLAIGQFIIFLLVIYY